MSARSNFLKNFKIVKVTKKIYFDTVRKLRVFLVVDDKEARQNSRWLHGHGVGVVVDYGALYLKGTTSW